MDETKNLQIRLCAPSKSSNRGKLGKVRIDAINALADSLRAASPQLILKESVKIVGERLWVNSTKLDLSEYRRILVIGGGKASAFMAEELERLLGSRITGGIVNVPDYLKPKPKLKKIKLHDATHPIPSEVGQRGVEKMLELVAKPSEDDLVICLISGGGSALMPMPVEGLKLSDKQRVTDLLLRSGSPIREINTVRKHLSGIKGGRLAERLYPARVLSLIISDVVGDELDAIASGPTVPDATTFLDAKNILVSYNLWGKIPASVRKVVEQGVLARRKETPKAGSKIFERVSNVLVGTNKRSCIAAMDYLKSKGYKAMILSTRVQGEAKEIGKIYSGIMKDIAFNGFPFRSPAALVVGGESTVTVEKTGGKGGRNQELVLSSLSGIDILDTAVVASIGTDGVDGPTEAAGAIGDGKSLERARKLKLDPVISLSTHDSYPFFKKLGDLLVTGPTGTNVNDISILIVG